MNARLPPRPIDHPTNLLPEKKEEDASMLTQMEQIQKIVGRA